MGIRKTVVKKVGSSDLPKAARGALHTGRHRVERATNRALDRAIPARRRRSRRRSALAGLGAAAAAVPVGMWLGRRMRADNSERNISPVATAV